jgi:hypothetical protein
MTMGGEARGNVVPHARSGCSDHATRTSGVIATGASAYDEVAANSS